MRKQEPTQIKLLHKRFQFLNKNQISIIYDFCEEDELKTQKILTIIKDTKCSTNIIKTLLERPEKSQSLLASFQRRYDQQYGRKDKQRKRKEEGGGDGEGGKIEFFNYVPKDVLMGICMYLDLYSMIKFSSTCSKISRLFHSQTFQIYYKNLCVNLFQTYTPRLPPQCRFSQVKTYILKHPNQFGPNTRRAVTNNLRQYVWQKQVLPEKKASGYYQGFGSYRNLFYNLPRVHLNGLYICKHQYRKEEQKNLLTNTGQVHFIYYYRYFRFFQEGSVLSAVFTQKQQISFIAQIMNKSVFEVVAKEDKDDKQEKGEKIDKNLMVGEYVQQGNNIQAKLFKQGAIFTFNLQILKPQQKQSQQPCTKLLVKQYKIRVVDEKQIIQTLQIYDPKNPIVFRYVHVPTLCKENSRLISSSSL